MPGYAAEMHPLRDLAVFTGRAVVGGYVMGHGAQKLLGAFGGKGLERASADFERMGLTPARSLALLGSTTEIVGGALTALGIAHPIGELMVVGDMAVAATAHRSNGPFAATRGFELPATNLAFAAVLAAVGPGPLRLGPKASRRMMVLATAGGAAVAWGVISRMVSGNRAERPEPEPDATEIRDDAAVLASEQAAWVPANA